MCIDPGTMALISMGLQGASMASQYAASRQSEGAVRRAAELESARQREYQQQANARLRETTDALTPENQAKQRAGIVEQLQEQLAPTASAAAVGAGNYAQVNPSANQVVAGSVADAVQRGINKGQQTATAAAALDSYGRQGFDNSVTIGRSGESLNQMFNNMNGSLGAYELELEAARRKGSGMSAVADALGGAGSVASAYWLTNGGKAAKKRTTGMTSLPGGQI